MNVEVIALEYEKEDLEPGIERCIPYGRLAERVVELLRAEDVYEPHLIYRGFSRSRIPEVLENGTDRDRNSSLWYGGEGIPVECLTYASMEGDGTGGNAVSDNLEDAIHSAFIHEYLANGHEPRNYGEFALIVYKEGDLELISAEWGCYRSRNGFSPVVVITCVRR